MPRKALPVHVDTVPANEIDRLVIPMANLAARRAPGAPGLAFETWDTTNPNPFCNRARLQPCHRRRKMNVVFSP